MLEIRDDDETRLARELREILTSLRRPVPGAPLPGAGAAELVMTPDPGDARGRGRRAHDARGHAPEPPR